MKTTYDISAPKKPTNLTLNSDLLSQARALDVNLSAVFEQALAQEVRRLRAQAWLAENQQAIKAYNADVDEAGTFSAGLRSF
jgi:antitoxin CcdA